MTPSPTAGSSTPSSTLGPRPLRAAAAVGFLVAAATLTLGGCGKNTTAPTGLGDFGGNRLLAFASDRGNTFGQYDIYLWDYDSLFFRNTNALRSLASETSPSISSDGLFIAFQVNRGDANGNDIEVYDRRNVTIDNLATLNTTADETEPVFTGNGRRLVYTQGSPSRVRMFDGPTHLPVALPGLDTTASYSDYSPAPNYDGSLIAFVSTRAGAPHVYIYDANRHIVLRGAKLQQTLETGSDDLDPRFSRDGRFLVFASTRGVGQGRRDLYVLEFLSGPTPATYDTLLHVIPNANTASDERHPSFSDDGRLIVFQSDRPGGIGSWDLWTFDSGTGTVSPPALPFGSTGNDAEPSLKWPY